MIRRLTLESYGKFRDADFDFGPFTVICGPNEAGKTTIFDALFEAACAEAPHRGQVWARLTDRYGQDRRFRVGGATPKFRNGVEFLELYAIRAGQISVEAEKGGSWAEAARRSLFRHGYNPQDIAEQLEKRASANNATRHQRALNGLNNELGLVRSDIEKLREQEAESAGARAGLARLDGEIAALELRGAALDGEIAATGEKLESFRKVRTLRQALQNRDFIAGVLQAEKKRAELAAFQAGAVKDYDALLAAAAAAERGAAEAAGAAGAAKAAVARLEHDSCSLLESRQQARKAAEAAEKFLPRAEKIMMLRYGLYASLHLPPWLRYLAWAVGAAGAALSLWLGGLKPAGYAGAGCFAAAAAALDWYMFRPKTSPSDLAAEKNGLAAIYGDWAALGLPRADIERDAAAGVAAALANMKNVALSWDFAVENNRKEGEAARALFSALGEKLEALEDERGQAERAAAAWLAAAGCADRDEYLARARSQEALAAGAERDAGRVKELLDLESCSSSGALLSLLDARVKALEAAGVRDRADYERDIEAAEERQRELAGERAAADLAVNSKKVEREGLAAVFNRDLARLPAELNALRRRQYELEAEIAAEGLARAGAALAAGLFREIEKDSSRKFTGLAGEVGRLLERVLPAGGLSISSLGLEGVAVRDAGGELRALNHLSSGTADCFMLAARLSLAAADRGAEPGLLLLDDPFPALDAARRSAALGLLKAFQAERGWQVVLFTKDRALLAAVENDPQVTPLTLAL